MAIDLELLKKEYEEATKSTESGFWIPKLGDNLLRVLGPSKREKSRLFYRKVGVHYGVDTLGLVFCLDKTWGKACPVCEFVEKLRAVGSVEALNLAKRFRVTERYMINVVSLDEVAKTGIAVVKQWLAPKTVRLELLKIMLDEDWGDITDLETGRNLVVEKSEKQGSAFTSYSIRPKPDRTKFTLLKEDDIPSFDELLDRYYKTYDEIKEAMLRAVDAGVGDDLDDYVRIKLESVKSGESNGEAKVKKVDEVKKSDVENKKEEVTEQSKEELMQKAMSMLQTLMSK